MSISLKVGFRVLCFMFNFLIILCRMKLDHIVIKCIRISSRRSFHKVGLYRRARIHLNFKTATAPEN